MTTILIVHVFACLFMTGAIWLVQALVYPNFKLIGKTEFEKFHQFHMNRITWIVAPVMALELVTGVLLFFELQNSFMMVNIISVLLLWVLTAAINVPSHKKLSYEVDQSKLKLIYSNWPRTLVWSIRSVIWMWYLGNQMNGASL